MGIVPCGLCTHIVKLMEMLCNLMELYACCKRLGMMFKLTWLCFKGGVHISAAAPCAPILPLPRGKVHTMG